MYLPHVSINPTFPANVLSQRFGGQGDTKKKERESAKKGVQAALDQFEIDPIEARMVRVEDSKV